MKTCILCNEEKPIEEFEKDARYKTEDNRTNRCRECKNKQTNKAYKAFGRLKERYPDVPIEVTKEEVEQLFEAFEGTCCYCGVEESEETGTLHLEHIRSLSKGGRNHISNLVISCGSCNSKKFDKPILTFYLQHSRLDYDYLNFLVKYIAKFSNRTIEEVEAELVEEHRNYLEEKAKDDRI